MSRAVSDIVITKSLGKAFGFPVGNPSMKVSFHKDYASSLILARTLPIQFMPLSKLNVPKRIWFCDEINKRKISLLKSQQQSIWDTI